MPTPLIDWVTRPTVGMSRTPLTTVYDDPLDPFVDESALYSIHGYLTMTREEPDAQSQNPTEPVLGHPTKLLDAAVTPHNSPIWGNRNSDRFDRDIRRAVHKRRPHTEEHPAGSSLPTESTRYQRRHGRGFAHVFKPLCVVGRLRPAVLPVVDCNPRRDCNVLDHRMIHLANTHSWPDLSADNLRGEPWASEVANGIAIFGSLRPDTISGSVDRDRRCPRATTAPCHPARPPPPPPSSLPFTNACSYPNV